MTYLQAWNTGITKLNVNGLKNLKAIDFSDCPQLVGDFDLSDNVALDILQTFNTKISSLNIDGLINLKTLDISNCPNLVGDFDLSANSNLSLIYTYKTGISSLNLDGLTNLVQVDISDCPNLTGEFDFRENTELERMNAHTTQIRNVNVTGLAKLKMFSIANTNIGGEFDFTGNTALEELILNGSRVTGINIQGLTNLTLVDISDNPKFVGAVDFASNPELKFINANNTNIHSINVQGLRNLTQLGIANTLVPSLDVSTNTNLQQLNVRANLTWLNTGDNANLTEIIKGDSVIDLGEIGDSFNIATVTEAFKGIDISKVTIVSGATYDPATGEVSGYQNGTPIVYRYDSGTMQNGEAVTLTVTLNFTKDASESTIRINSYEGKPYDGTAVSNPTDVVTTGSSGAVTFEWFTKDESGEWVSLGEQAPINVGNYGVKAHLAADQNYAAADSGEPTPFEITKATSTVEILDDLNKTYDGEAVKDPSVKVEGTSETATIAWFKKESDTVTRAVTWTPLTSAPVNAGDYKVVVTVAENNNSLGATAEQEFTIAKAATNVSIEGTLDKEYNGVEVEVPNIKVEGSSGVTTIEWYKKDVNGAWELLTNAPKEIGEYKIVVKVEEDENYLSGEVEQTFAISEKVEVPSTPEEGGDNTTTEEEKVEDSIEGVQTGDVTQTSMWTMLVGLSMSMMYFFRRKKNK
ncbi:MAG: MBG domain-containing protein [Erysipelotrichaceae bacterium]|nr:MBG domain-containing protein [Erysipelotrichaceae bacterium]